MPRKRHQSGRGSHDRALRYPEPPAEAGVAPSPSAAATRTTRRLRRSTACSRPELIHRRDPSGPSKPSRSPPANGSTGSTPAACSNRSGLSLPPRPKRGTQPGPRCKPWPPDPNRTASGKPAAVQPLGGETAKHLPVDALPGPMLVVGRPPRQGAHRLVGALRVTDSRADQHTACSPHAALFSISRSDLSDLTPPAVKGTPFIHSLKNAFARGGRYCPDAASIDSLTSARSRSSMLANDQSD